MSRHQRRSSAHQVFLEFHKHRPTSMRKIDEEDEAIDGENRPTSSSGDYKFQTPTEQPFEMFHHVCKTGVIYATSRAQKYGFHAEDPEWANMGQGAPETGPLPGAPSRDFHMNIHQK